MFSRCELLVRILIVTKKTVIGKDIETIYLLAFIPLKISNK